ncbi:hypothetical protein EDC02_7957 [Micromonospora sp. Llam0]|uniref:hypothetical protein n=1 Tax=Micromonospora sp. Llam0 TaxID=2485143 RepID=UPI000FBC08A1|nr:hypothetical protein [Micromonospora sp. Llam0]ROO53002.1 hypothetical protein EDC02_7957 [Micromonospora sp. Llam0]
MSLVPGETTPTVRMTAADGVRAIDVADRALATGVIRPGQEPPRWPGPRFWLWPAVGLVVAALLLPVAYRAAGVRRRLPDHHP